MLKPTAVRCAMPLAPSQENVEWTEGRKQCQSGRTAGAGWASECVCPWPGLLAGPLLCIGCTAPQRSSSHSCPKRK